MEDPVTVKAEPDDASPAPLDEDIYEDAGDLDFFEPTSQNANLYLARVPQYVWDAWDKLDADSEIPSGTIRQWTETDKSGVAKASQVEVSQDAFGR